MTDLPLPISLIVPCRNEAANLEILLPRLRGIARELIVVDGHSTDRTRELAEEHGAIYLLINVRCGSRLSDSQNGFRAARTALLRELNLTSDKHTVELEMTMRALRKGARVVEAATHEFPRRFGRSSLSVTRQGLLFLWYYLRECVRPL